MPKQKIHPPRQLPPLPHGLSWPRPRIKDTPEAERTDDDFDRQPEYCGKPGGLARYLKNVWKPLIPYIDMPTLRDHWPRLGEAIDRQRPNLPKELTPLVRKELTDRTAAAIPNRADRPYHLEKALQMRAYRARRKAREQKL